MTIHVHVRGGTEVFPLEGLAPFPNSGFPELVEACPERLPQAGSRRGLPSSPGGVSKVAEEERREGFDKPVLSSVEGLSQVGEGSGPQTEAETHFRAALSALETTHADTTQGWTPQRQSQFLAAIADGATVQDAAKEVGLSRRSAYALRRRANGQAFNLGWQAAEILARDSLRDELWDRARNGQSWTTVRDDGEKVITTTRHRHDNRLALAMLTRLETKVVEAYDAPEVMLADKFDEFLALLETGEAPNDPVELLDRIDPCPELDDDIGTCEPCESLAPGRDDPPVYETSLAGGDWWTDFPPQPDFAGEQEGRFGEPGYQRELDPCEQAMIAHFTRNKPPVADPATLAKAEAARDAWFEAAAGYHCAEDVKVVVESEDRSPPFGRGDGAGAPTGEGLSTET